MDNYLLFREYLLVEEYLLYWCYLLFEEYLFFGEYLLFCGYLLFLGFILESARGPDALESFLYSGLFCGGGFDLWAHGWEGKILF